MADLLRKSVYQSIRRAIIDCELLLGQEFRETTLAEKYYVSRSPVRDALLVLESEHLVTVLPRQGYVINPIDRKGLDELFDLRHAVSPASAASAAAADKQAGAISAVSAICLGQMRRLPCLTMTGLFIIGSPNWSVTRDYSRSSSNS